MKKKVGIIVAAILVVALVVGGFYLVVRRSSNSNANADETLTEVQKIITKDLDKNYPKTPREVVKLYNRIITAYYKEDLSNDELTTLTKMAWMMFDADLQKNNPMSEYLGRVKAEIVEYNNASKYISSSTVCDSKDVLYLEDNGDQISYVSASYFMKAGSEFSRTYETYVLRQDKDGKWKILVYYQTEKESEDD